MHAMRTKTVTHVFAVLAVGIATTMCFDMLKQGQQVIAAPFESDSSLEGQLHCRAQRVMEMNALRKLRERANWFEAEISHEREYFRTAKLDSYTAGFLFAPYYTCPYTLEKSPSVREHFDGGKWMCGLQELRDGANISCKIFSFGSNYETSFEDGIDIKQCDVHIFDPTMASVKAGHSRSKLDEFKSNLPTNYHFHELGIGSPGQGHVHLDGEKFDAISLVDALKEYGGSYGVDFLKFDVEGFEFDVLEHAEWEGISVGVLLFEMHGHLIERVQSVPYTLMKFHEHLSRLEQAGFRIYSMEPVCSGCRAQFEVAAVHKDWHPIHKFANPCRQ